MNLKTAINNPKIWLKSFPWKKKKDHKYSRGKLVVLGSQKHMTGATILSAESALRVGTGSVKILCSKQTLPIYSARFPSALKKEINNTKALGRFISKEKSSTYLIGPGAGLNNLTKRKTQLILRKVKHTVVDADALTCFKDDLKSLYSLVFNKVNHHCYFTTPRAQEILGKKCGFKKIKTIGLFFGSSRLAFKFGKKFGNFYYGFLNKISKQRVTKYFYKAFCGHLVVIGKK